MSVKKKRVLGRGMAELVDGSFSSIIEPHEPRDAREGREPRESRLTPPAAPEKPALPAQPAGPMASIPAAPPQPSLAASPSGNSAAETARAFEVISISSGKGGTGKSVLTTNLGVLLAAGSRVTILDADLGLANIHILFNMMPRYNTSHVITGEKTLEEVTIRGPRGVNVVPGGSGIPEMANLTEARFASLVAGIGGLEQSTDLLLIDTPSGIDRQSLAFLLASDQVIVVTTEDITAMTDAYAVIKTVTTRRPDATVVLVVNQAGSYADGLETFHKIAHVARKFLGRELALGGIIPFDEMVERSVAERVPVTISHPISPASRAMASIAGRIGTFRVRPAGAAQPFAARLRRLMPPAPRQTA